MQREIRRWCGGFVVDAESVPVVDVAGRVLPQRRMPEVWGESAPAVDSAAVYEELPLADVPLIVEDLLLQAKRLADAGATIECIEKILERVAALREGRPDG